jgi:hypothetical protein
MGGIQKSFCKILTTVALVECLPKELSINTINC